METLVVDTNIIANMFDHTLQYSYRLPQEDYKLNLIKWHQGARLLVLVSGTYVFSIFFETAKLKNFSY